MQPESQLPARGSPLRSERLDWGGHRRWSLVKQKQRGCNLQLKQRGYNRRSALWGLNLYHIKLSNQLLFEYKRLKRATHPGIALPVSQSYLPAKTIFHETVVTGHHCSL